MKEIYQSSVKEVLGQMGSREEGLTIKEVEKSREKCGWNELAEGKKKSVLQIFLEQYKDFLVIILIASAIISGILGDAESAAVIVIVILWLSAITSAFVDNIPFAATMIPVIRAIAATEGMDIGVLAWALSLGTDLGGNATPIGASANVVGTSASAKGGYPIGWGRYCKYCVPATIIVMAVSTAYLFLRYL